MNSSEHLLGEFDGLHTGLWAAIPNSAVAVAHMLLSQKTCSFLQSRSFVEEVTVKVMHLCACQCYMATLSTTSQAPFKAKPSYATFRTILLTLDFFFCSKKRGHVRTFHSCPASSPRSGEPSILYGLRLGNAG